jgi:RimJ/RimL family protein N-acetyltransferase
VELKDADLLLRAPTRADVPAIAAACSDEEMARFIPGFPSPYTEDDARAWVDSRNEDAGSKTFLIVDAQNDRLFGAIEVRLGEEGIIGYWIAADARGRGIATRALRLLATWSLTEGGVEHLKLMTHPENIASQRVAEKAGFVHEGIVRNDTRFADGQRDSVMYSLRPADLPRLRAAFRAIQDPAGEAAAPARRPSGA